MTKYCKYCDRHLDASAFTVRKASQDGLSYKCRSCSAAYQKEHYPERREKIIRRSAEWAKTHKQRRKEIRAKNAAKPSSAEKRNAAARRRRKENPEKHREQGRVNANLFRERKPHRHAEIGKKARQKMRDKDLGKWRALGAASAARRRAAKRFATPVWVDFSAIKAIYLEASRLREVFGDFYEVDHIVPLISDEVCGLHVPWNLRIVYAGENRRKSNKLIHALAESA